MFFRVVDYRGGRDNIAAFFVVFHKLRYDKLMEFRCGCGTKDGCDL